MPSGGSPEPADYARLERQQQALDDTRDSVTSLRKIISDQVRIGDSADRELWSEFAASFDERIRNIERTINLLTPNFNLTVIQNASQTSTMHDTSALARELSELIMRAQRDGLPADSEQVAALTAARDAAVEGDDKAAIGYLRKAATYIAGVARDIAVPVTVGLIKEHFGIK
jgi:hypothetical protein